MDANLQWRPAEGHGDEVLYAVDGPLGRVRLNRPKAINALDRASVDSLTDQLTTWAGDPAIEAVFVDGSGERGLCAGGDIRQLRGAILEGRPEDTVDYWRAEYVMNALIANYPKPYVAWMDGIVMGGGVGVSGHGSLRLTTQNTKLAMPETGIGFFPDVGATYYLSRSPGETGTHIALTGTAVSGADAVYLGLADTVVPADRKETVLAALRENPTMDVIGVTSAVGSVGVENYALGEGEGAGKAAGAQAADQESGHSGLQDERDWIDYCYAAPDAASIIKRLASRPEPAAQQAAETIAGRSPYSVAITLEALRRAASLDVREVLAQDLRLGAAFAAYPDFVEGVRAQVIDKDRRPHWRVREVGQISAEQLNAAFRGPE